MDQTAHVLATAHEIYARANSTSPLESSKERPPVYKAIGISLAVASGCFIGVSFVLKKVGLLKANEKYDEVAGEGYGYLKNVFWWTGMTLMIIGEICNFVAYAFVDAILVTPLGALSVVITTILSAIFLKERLSMVGKVGCFLCIIGSVVIVMNAPSESSVATIQDMQHFVIAPGFLSYAGVVIVGCAFIALWAGPRYGKKSMLVYISICSLIGGLSVVATQGLGAAIVSQIGGVKQYDQWFLYVLFVFVIATLLTEIIYLNKALNLFNAALVTPTYYVFFTSSTIITSTVLFRGFKGTPTSIISVVMGFLVICSGVVLLQLSKSAKDVPDAAVFAGDLDQVRTIAEQEQPESEPKADAIRGTAAIIRRLSTLRSNKELEEAKRIHDEKQLDLQSIGEDGVNVQYEWDGLRRRRTTFGTNRTNPSVRSRDPSTPFPAFDPNVSTPQHPPLGMSRFPSDSDSEDEERPLTRGSSVFNRMKSVIVPGRRRSTLGSGVSQIQSPMHPVPLTEIAIPSYKGDDPNGPPYYDRDTQYRGAGERHITIVDEGGSQRTGSRGSSLHPDAGPIPPQHSARRQFSFQNVFRKGQGAAQPPGDELAPPSRSPMIRQGLGQRRGSRGAHVKGATEEERLGLVKGDTGASKPSLPPYDGPPALVEDDDEWLGEDKLPGQMRDLTPPRSRELEKREEAGESSLSEDDYTMQKRKARRERDGSPPPPFDDSKQPFI
ncbi:Multidrug resistance efflux transporter EmrE [Venustampulla echinocandica]|uniref:Multidrug resistance efflux transporter EmrE n=1 Tax=Venustampulla echinocandica TaxID=2656787 RepID=A0A370TFY4_9HELO|nr:Multidrug resistance efflux transporter EmrE [Venustampulla echinocandica]RDL33805.1 Multidrug resistance efflux transporter EmrE [Venustampulla echinocandica]